MNQHLIKKTCWAALFIILCLSGSFFRLPLFSALTTYAYAIDSDYTDDLAEFDQKLWEDRHRANTFPEDEPDVHEADYLADVIVTVNEEAIDCTPTFRVYDLESGGSTKRVSGLLSAISAAFGDEVIVDGGNFSIFFENGRFCEGMTGSRMYFTGNGTEDDVQYDNTPYVSDTYPQIVWDIADYSYDIRISIRDYVAIRNGSNPTWNELQHGYQQDGSYRVNVNYNPANNGKFWHLSQFLGIVDAYYSEPNYADGYEDGYNLSYETGYNAGFNYENGELPAAPDYHEPIDSKSYDEGLFYGNVEGFFSGFCDGYFDRHGNYGELFPEPDFETAYV